jgi:hypothetical protein
MRVVVGHGVVRGIQIILQNQRGRLAIHSSSISLSLRGTGRAPGAATRRISDAVLRALAGQSLIAKSQR